MESIHYTVESRYVDSPALSVVPIRVWASGSNAPKSAHSNHRTDHGKCG
jgi:hypothetical protein